ncbi:MAG: DUF2807 domain-containing protein [Oscillospiraceae bacterium]|nr:DUF2807 domain-containing protein [Oscillospiraceae bacterium]
MRKLLALGLVLSLAIALGGCSLITGSFRMNSRTVLNILHGCGNVIQQEFTIDDVPEFTVPGEDEHWAMLALHVRVSMHHFTGTIVLDESLGNTIILRTDENLMPMLSPWSTDYRVDISLMSTRLTPTELVIESGLPFTHIDLNGAWDITYRHSNVPLAQLGIRGAVTGDFTIDRLNVPDDDERACGISVHIEGAASLTLRGQSRSVWYTINGTGNVYAFDLITSSTSVTLNGVGNAEVYASDELTVEINGIGDVIYDGDPTIINQQTGLLNNVRAR